MWGTSAAALFVVEVEADATLLSVALADTCIWVPVEVLFAEYWTQFALARCVREVNISSISERGRPGSTVTNGWLNTLALAIVTVPNFKLGLFTIHTLRCI